MKNTTFAILTFIFGVSAKATFIWAIIEFCLYLFKDNPMNWLSVILIPIFAILTFVSFILAQVK